MPASYARPTQATQRIGVYAEYAARPVFAGSGPSHAASSLPNGTGAAMGLYPAPADGSRGLAGGGSGYREETEEL